MIPRKNYIDHLSRFRDTPVIKVLTGLRRSGKSTLLKLTIEQLKADGVPESRILYVDKESLEFDAVRSYKDLQKLVMSRWKQSTGRKYLFVDEIQEIEGWEKAITSLLGQKSTDIYVSGSNAHLLSSELATRLSGRYVEIPVLPLTYAEYRRFREANNDKASNDEQFSSFLKYGGLPGIHEFDLSDTVVFQYLHSIFNTILYKDIVTRYKIRDTAMLDRIARFAFDNCGSVTSAQKISEYIKSQRIRVATDTVLNYLEYLVSAFLLRRARRFDVKGKRHLEVNDKYYLGDIGLRHGFIGYRDADVSGLLENVVFLELLHRGYSVSVGKVQNREIDFIAEKGVKKIYVQVCYLLADARVEEREFGPLREIDDNHPKFVLSMDRDWGHGREGIHRIYLPDFLLGAQPTD